MIASQTQPVRRCHVYSADPEQAADELYQQLWQPDCSLVLLFVAPDYQLDKLAPALARRFGDVPVVGCTTAGEISPDGYRCHSIVGASFAAPDFFSVIKRIDALPDFDLSDALGTVMAARYALGQKCGFPLERRTFALLLVDGLSAREELGPEASDGKPTFGALGHTVSLDNFSVVTADGLSLPAATLSETWRPARGKKPAEAELQAAETGRLQHAGDAGARQESLQHLRLDRVLGEGDFGQVAVALPFWRLRHESLS